MSPRPVAPKATLSVRAITCLGLTQLVGWGVSFYLLGTLGQAMAADLGWSITVLFGGFSCAIVVMALISPWAGRAIDCWGGHRVMPVGAVLIALGCVGIASSHTVVAYYLAWLVMGVGMRLCLYDAAFASLARAGGPNARRAMSQITLLGGLASTALWPLGHALAEWLGWRGAVLAYAVFALATLPLYLSLPRARFALTPTSTGTVHTGLAHTAEQRRVASILFAVIAMLTNFLATGNAAHLIAMLSGLGLLTSTAVSVAALWGVGQFIARLADVVAGGRMHPLTLTMSASAVLPLAFFVAWIAGAHPAAAAAYTLLYGGCNGLLTIARGTLPLALFDFRSYGSVVGALLIPSYLLTATAPLAYAYVIEHFGARAAMGMSATLAAIIFIAAALLRSYFSDALKPVDQATQG